MSAFEEIQEVHRPRTSHVAFLRELYNQGAPLEESDVKLLVENGVITDDVANAELAKPKQQSALALDRYVLDHSIYELRCAEQPWYAEWTNKDIDKTDWECLEPALFTDSFVDFIDSHYRRFCDLIAYKEFWLYKEQARRWLLDPLPDLDQMDRYEQREHYKREFSRIKQNSLYGLDRYGWYKESSLPGGEGKYIATMAMSFLAFLVDTGRSAYVGKGRQITSTTTFTMIMVLKMITRRNFYAKLIACDLDTTEEIFEDKFKYAFGRFQDWMKPKVENDSGKLFRVSFNRSENKGSRKAMASKIGIVAPKLSAINGGAPDIVLVDEAPFLDIFHGMVAEGKPTLFVTVNGKLVLRRQLFAWGTGGRSAKGGGSFEREHRGGFNKWQNRDFSDGIVPIFLDWTCRPNITTQHYLNEKLSYMAGSIDGHNVSSTEERELLFRQHYPSSIDDMYSIGSVTLVPMSFILKQDDKIAKLPLDMKPVYGRFEPVYDITTKNPPESFHPHPIKSAQFIPMGEHAVGAPVTMFMKPRKTENVYYEYTDPIVNDEGYSMQASAIIDAEFNTIPCLVNCRFDDPLKAYTQSKLMGMYYANVGEKYCLELIENNIGKMYVNWLKSHEWQALPSLITNWMLPSLLQGGGEQIGIDTRDVRKPTVIDLGKNWLLSHGVNVYQPALWSQLKFFTGKTSNTGKTRWQVDNRKLHQDDVVDAVFGAVVAQLCFITRAPRTIKDGEAKVSETDNSFHLQYNRASGRVQRVDSKGNIVRTELRYG